MWAFRCYTSSGNIDLINQWLEEQDSEVRADADAALEYLSQRPVNEWGRPLFAPLSNGLSEIRIKAKSGNYRIVGFFGPNKSTYTLLVGFRKQRDSDTTKAIKMALKRRKEIESGSSRITECQFP